MISRPVILIISPKFKLRTFILNALKTAGYNAVAVNSLRGDIEQFPILDLAMIIFDIDAIGLKDILLLKDFRENAKSPLILVSTSNNLDTITDAMNQGVDDYLTNPYNASELLARVRINLLRNHLPAHKEIFAIGNLEIDFESRTVRKNGEGIKLTHTEYSMLLLFAHHLNTALAYDYILKYIWGETHSKDLQYVRVFIGQLRKKIEDFPSQPKIIQTVPWFGYRMQSSI
jgi:two-component system KDP operon response regulator KdpE